MVVSIGVFVLLKEITLQPSLQYDELTQIDGMNLTRRQVDVASCLIGRQKHKESSRILSISPSTFVEHLSNLKLLLKKEISAQTDLLEFLETSTKYDILKKHYIGLLIQHAFERELVAISKDNDGVIPISLLISDHVDKKCSLMKSLLRHFKRIGFDLSLSVNEKLNQSQVLSIVDINEVPKEKFLHVDCIIYLDRHNSAKNTLPYYESFFKVIENILDEELVQKAIENFNRKKIAYENNLFPSNFTVTPSTYNTHNKKEEKNVTGFKASMKYVLPASMILMILSFYYFIPSIYPQEKHGARISDISANTMLLPPRNNGFSGRDKEISQLEEFYEDKNIGISTKSIVGAGGIGKTQLATEYAYRSLLKGKYDMIFWVAAHSEAAIGNSYRNFAEKFSLKIEGLHFNEVVRAVHSKILEDSGERVLIVLDNATNDIYLQQYISDLHEQIQISKVVHLLITSRDQHWDRDILMLDIFSKQEAKQFVEEQLQMNNNPQIDILVEKLHYFPLALSQALSYIKQHTNIVDFLNLYEEKQLKYLDTKNSNLYQETLWGTFNISFDKLSPVAKRILYMSAYLYPDNISFSIFDNFKLEDRVNAINELRKHSLIFLSEDGEYFKIHRLLQEVIIIKIGDDPKVLDNLLNIVYADINNFDKLDKSTWNNSKKWLMHMTDIASYMSDDQKKGDILHQVGNIARYFGLYGLAQDYLLEALKVKKMHLDPQSRADIMDLLSAIGKVEMHFGRYNAAKHMLEGSVKINEEVHKNPQDLRMASVLRTLSFVEQRLGNYTIAKKYGQMALKINESHYDNDNIALAQPLHYLGVIEYGLGNYRDAENYLQRSLEIKNKHYSDKNDIDFAFSYYNLGHLYRCKNDLKKAESFLQKSVEIFKANNNNGVNMAYPMFDLALILELRGQFQEAKKCLKTAYERWINHHLSYCKEVVAYLYSPVVRWPAYNANNKQVAAYYEDVLPYVKDLFGDEHHFVAKYNYMVARAYNYANNRGLAKKWLEQSLQIALKAERNITDLNLKKGHKNNVDMVRGILEKEFNL